MGTTLFNCEAEAETTQTTRRWEGQIWAEDLAEAFNLATDAFEDEFKCWPSKITVELVPRLFPTINSA